MPQQHTVLSLIDATAERLDAAGVAFGHGTANAFDEAAWLVLWRLDLPLDDLDAAAPRVVTPDEERAVQALVAERIATRKPAAYLTREAWLQGVPFYVDERVIVPRSLIAEPLAEGVFDAWVPAAADHDAPLRVLDMCTGNGSLAVLAALAWPHAQVDAADLSDDALAVARINLERHGLQHRVSLHRGNGWAAVAGRGPYDLVLCNPPYVNADSMSRLPLEYLAEPALALAGGLDGMDFVRPFLRRAAQHLRPDGALVLEIGHERPYFEAAFPQLQGMWLATSAGEDAVVLLDRHELEPLAQP